MPAESVLDLAAFGEEETRGLRVEVVWRKRETSGVPGYIQLATVADKLPAVESEQGANGWFASLDRQGCNNLIKYLRRARDQAYGRDE